MLRWGRGVAIIPVVGLGWSAPLTMSGQTKPTSIPGPYGSEIRPGGDAFRASTKRELRYLLAISNHSRKTGMLSPAGVVHSLGVCLIEDYAVARGKGKPTSEQKSGTMPRFVDTKLDVEQRRQFLAFSMTGVELVDAMQAFADNGYRVGVSWSGETQAYTVSLTCRASGDPNEGLCMTSFAGSLDRAIALAVFKHTVVTEGVWMSGVGGEREDFG